MNSTFANEITVIITLMVFITSSVLSISCSPSKKSKLFTKRQHTKGYHFNGFKRQIAQRTVRLKINTVKSQKQAESETVESLSANLIKEHTALKQSCVDASTQLTIEKSKVQNRKEVYSKQESFKQLEHKTSPTNESTVASFTEKRGVEKSNSIQKQMNWKRLFYFLMMLYSFFVVVICATVAIFLFLEVGFIFGSIGIVLYQLLAWVFVGATIAGIFAFIYYLKKFRGA